MDWKLLMPEIIVAVTLLIVLVADFTVSPGSNRRGIGLIALFGVTLALGTILVGFQGRGQIFDGLLVLDTVAVSFRVIFLLAAVLVLLSSFNYLERLPGRRGEFYWLILTALLGMMVTAAASELITIYVGIELISLSFYALVGSEGHKDGVEAALKYFILGCFAIGLWLYGAALLFGLTGTTDLVTISLKVSSLDNTVGFVALILLLAGFGFKMGLSPMHMWIPDAYQGAPTPATAFLAVGSKAAAFAVFLRVMGVAFGPLAAKWMLLLGVVAAITMTWGNVAALFQGNIKRMLAYSGVAHAGYTLIGVAAMDSGGTEAVIFYLLGYLFANLGAFAVVIAVSNVTGSDNIAGYAGLRWRNPYLALGLAFCLLSLAGIPPLAGFLGKLYLFWSAARQGGWMLALVIIAALNSAISLYYYVNVIRTMFLLPPKEETPLVSSAGLNVSLAVALIGVVLAILYTQPVLSALSPAGAISFLH